MRILIRTAMHLFHCQLKLSEGLANKAMALLNKIAECAFASGVVFKDVSFGNALRDLFVGLCIGNCVLYKQSLYALAHVSGNAYYESANIPTSEIN